MRRACGTWVWPRLPRSSALLVAVCAYGNTHGDRRIRLLCMRIVRSACAEANDEERLWLRQPNCIRQKRRYMSDVPTIVCAASRHGPRVAVTDQCDQTASPDRLRSSRYFFLCCCLHRIAVRKMSVDSTVCLSVVFTWLYLHGFT